MLNIFLFHRIKWYQWTTSISDAGGAIFAVKLRNNFGLYGRYNIFIFYWTAVFSSIKNNFKAGIQLCNRGNIAYCR